MITTDITSTAGYEIPNSSPSDVIIRSKAELFGRGKLIEIMNLKILEWYSDNTCCCCCGNSHYDDDDDDHDEDDGIQGIVGDDDGDKSTLIVIYHLFTLSFISSKFIN